MNCVMDWAGAGDSYHTAATSVMHGGLGWVYLCRRIPLTKAKGALSPRNDHRKSIEVQSRLCLFI